MKKILIERDNSTELVQLEEALKDIKNTVMTSDCSLRINKDIIEVLDSRKNILAIIELDSSTKLTCKDCDILLNSNEEIKDISSEYNSTVEYFVKDLLVNRNTEKLKQMLKEILSDSKKALNIYLKISNILKDDYNKDSLNGGFVYQDSLFENEIFNLCKILKELKILSYFYTRENFKNYFRIGILSFNNPIYELVHYDLEPNIYEIDFILDSKTYSAKIIDSYDDPYDNILSADEIDSQIDSLKKGIENIEKYLLTL